ncbi:MAG: DPP IV N-terminal domain-containing protein [Terriglobales bacterium]
MRSSKLRLGILAAVCLTLVPVSLQAQGTLATYQSAEKFMLGNVFPHVRLAQVGANWIGNADRFWYVETGPEGEQFIRVDAARNTAGPAFDQVRIAAALSGAAHRPVAASHLPFFTFRYRDHEQAIQFNFQHAGWTCSLETYTCTQGKEIPALFPRYRYGPPPARNGPGAFENVSPNGQWTAFVRDHNLYVRYVTGAVVQLTHDGQPGNDYATPLPDVRTLVSEGVTNGDDVRERPAVFWSPDSTRLITYRLDSRNAGRYTSIQFVPPHQLRPIAYNYVYPLPGEVLPKAYPVIFNLDTGQRINVGTRPLSIQFQGGPGFRWLNNQTIFYRYDGRGEKYIGLRQIDARTGAQRLVYRETAKPYPYVDPGESLFQFVDHHREFLWASERSGWNQLYLYDTKTGQLINPVTHGDWVVRGITRVDEKAHEIYFLASGVDPRMDPYYTQLYRVNFAGTGMQLLTPGNSNHTASVSPDGQFIVDNESTVSDPGESVLRRASDGSVVRVLEHSDIAWLQRQGWVPPIHFEGKAADGKTDLYGVIVRPTHFDAAKKYAILENIYTGPQGFFAPKTFGAALRLQSMAELGFVVVMLDGRGTTGRSRAFHDFSYHNMGNVFVDHVAMIKQMAQKYPWMDLTRVGIYGTSAGGYGSAHAFLQFPGFYKVCVSTSGDHDPRMDKAWWNELYQGWPVGKDYAEQANEALAKNLQGHLLLMHGDIDDNVNPAETMRLVDALMTANKPFEMLLVPNMYHGDSGPHAHYVTLRRWNYFVQYLLGVTPPKNFVIRERPFRYGG